MGREIKILYLLIYLPNDFNSHIWNQKSDALKCWEFSPFTQRVIPEMFIYSEQKGITHAEGGKDRKRDRESREDRDSTRRKEKGFLP